MARIIYNETKPSESIKSNSTSNSSRRGRDSSFGTEYSYKSCSVSPNTVIREESPLKTVIRDFPVNPRYKTQQVPPPYQEHKICQATRPPTVPNNDSNDNYTFSPFSASRFRITSILNEPLEKIVADSLICYPHKIIECKDHKYPAISRCAQKLREKIIRNL